jgi:hypothetical protein
VTVGSGERITATISVPTKVGINPPEAQVRFGICYRTATTPPGAFNFFSGNGSDILVDFRTAGWQTLSSSGTVVPSSAGDYQVGMCFFSWDTLELEFDWSKGFVEVTN